MPKILSVKNVHLNALKKARLEQDFVLGIKKGTWFMIAIVGLSIGAYFYYKKISK